MLATHSIQYGLAILLTNTDKKEKIILSSYERKFRRERWQFSFLFYQCIYSEVYVNIFWGRGWIVKFVSTYSPISTVQIQLDPRWLLIQNTKRLYNI